MRHRVEGFITEEELRSSSGAKGKYFQNERSGLNDGKSNSLCIFQDCFILLKFEFMSERNAEEVPRHDLKYVNQYRKTDTMSINKKETLRLTSAEN